MSRPSTRSCTRRANSARLRLEDLPDALISHILSFVPATSLAYAERVSVIFRTQHVPVAIGQRLRLLGRARLPPPLNPKDTLQKRLQFCEVVAGRQPITISADTCHSIAIGPGGNVYAWGGHEMGPEEEEEEWPLDGEAPCWLSHLGLGKSVGSCVRTPRRIAPLVPSARGLVEVGLSRGGGGGGGVGVGVGSGGSGGALCVVEVAAGYEHSLLRTRCGLVFSCGLGDHGRLGHGTNILASSSSFRRIEALERVAQIAAGGFQSIALSEDGVAYSWGWGESGSTGHGERVHTHAPSVIEELASKQKARIVQVSPEKGMGMREGGKRGSEGGRGGGEGGEGGRGGDRPTGQRTRTPPTLSVWWPFWLAPRARSRRPSFPSNTFAQSLDSIFPPKAVLTIPVSPPPPSPLLPVANRHLLAPATLSSSTTRAGCTHAATFGTASSASARSPRTSSFPHGSNSRPGLPTGPRSSCARPRRGTRTRSA